jgi:MYXO-CTERM domain-containing protein
MLNIRRILAVAMVFCLATGVSFAYNNFVEVPPNTEPYSTERPPWLPPPAPNGDCTIFTVAQDLKDSCGDLKVEDFSSSTAEPGGVCSGISPLNSNTNDGCFNGTLNEGIEFVAIGIGEYAAVGTGFLGVGIPAVGANFFTDEASWSFDPAVQCVGFAVIGDLINPVTVDCVTDGGGAATVTGSLQGVFVGFQCPSGIGNITCTEQVDGSADLYGAFQFGDKDGDTGPPVPATGTWGMIALLGLLMVGSLFFMRRRAEA